MENEQKQCGPGTVKWIARIEQSAMPQNLVDYLTPRVKRLGYLGEWFRCAGHAPDVLLTFLRFTDALKDALPARSSRS